MFVFDKAVLRVSNETWKLNWNINNRKHLFLHFLELYAVCLRSVFFFLYILGIHLVAVQLLICDLTFVLYPSYVPPHYVMQYIDSVDKHSATHRV